MVITQRGGAFVRLRDLGYAELSTFEIESYSYGRGIPNISLGVRRQIGFQRGRSEGTTSWKRWRN